MNDAIRRDWKAIHNLIETRQHCNELLVQHPSIIVVPVASQQGHVFLVGLLGVLNGLLDEGEPPLEAAYDEDTHELMCFKVRGDNTPVVDQREVPMTQMQEGQVYRVTDRAKNRWEGTYVGPGQPDGEQGVHLQLQDATTALIYFHDVANVIRY
jgi:hypothetical protein